METLVCVCFLNSRAADNIFSFERSWALLLVTILVGQYKNGVRHKNKIGKRMKTNKHFVIEKKKIYIALTLGRETKGLVCS